MASEIETYFLLTVNTDGTLTTYPEIPKEALEAQRVANNYDVYQAAKQVVEEFENQLLANRVAQVVLAALQPAAPAGVPDTLKEKLKERGINPEGPAATE
jgi:hypothetical protein